MSVADVHNGSYTMKFDFIMCLNVLDRVDEPKSLLKVLTESIAPHGHLMLGVVLPFCGGVERGTRRYGKPTNPLAEMQGDCPSSTLSREPVEKSLVRFVDRVLPNFNLELLFATRVPYFSSGDIYSSWYLHTEFLLTCKQRCCFFQRWGGEGVGKLPNIWMDCSCRMSVSKLIFATKG